jgi:hypothetical protein
MDVTDAQICGMDGRAALALAHKVVAALEVASAQVRTTCSTKLRHLITYIQSLATPGNPGFTPE